MTMRLHGWTRRAQSFLARLVTSFAIAGLVAPPLSPALAANTAPPVLLATIVPMPRLNPQKPVPPAEDASPDDAIGSLIARDDSAESTASEDSDTPEVDALPPETDAPPPPPVVSASPPSKPVDAVGLKLAVKLLEGNDPAGAALAIYALPDRVDIKIVDYLIATGGYQGVPASSLVDLRKKLVGWPNQGLMQLRYEQALAREKPPAAKVVQLLGGTTPSSDSATLMLASAYIEVGRKDDAAALIRAFWRDKNFSESTEKQIAKIFGSLLRTSDHKWRMDRLLYASRSAEALRAASHLSKDQQALAKAVVLVIKQSSKAKKALDALPSSVKSDHLYIYSRIQVLRRAGSITEAGKLLASASRDPTMIVDPDAWWIERRLISRALIGIKNPALAYKIAAAHSAESSTLRAEAEFHAGWYALEFQGDAQKAIPHFAEIARISTMPLSVSRAEYWLGRAYAAAGNKEAAAKHFQAAAAYRTTFYGQLALARLGGSSLAITQPPPANQKTADRFAAREMVQVIRHLEAVGYGDRANVFYRFLADTLDDPAEIALLATMAERAGKHQVALQIGKVAAVRGMPVDTLAFPTAAIPSATQTPNIERPVVFAIARQESAFNLGAISGAGARGLLQLLPSTAKETAKGLGMTYSKARLTTDPAYNATLGAAYLGGLADNFGGSYVMTFAAYNAGASRVNEWVKTYGDPRDPSVDVVNWIELIPFTETRNYVQRIMENLQVYRARFGATKLAIESDLTRGARL